MKRTRPVVALGFALAAAVAAAGCSGDRADKAGGSPGPVVLRLGAAYGADQPDAQFARYFATQVAAASKGRMRITVLFGAGGDSVPDVEPRLARSVRDGDYDLGFVGARAWDLVGVTSFQALQAPFLITNYALLDEVVKDPIAEEMLSGLDDFGVVGLALIPGLLRHPVGFTRPLVSVDDFRGARIRANPSRATDEILRSLGATPVHLPNRDFGAGLRKHRFDGVETYLPGVADADVSVSANVVLFPKVLTLFADRDMFERLSEGQRATLRTAAQRTLAHTANHPVRHALVYESDVMLRDWCTSRRRGRAVLATPADLAGLIRATRPVYASLERNPQTKRFIAEIGRLSASLPPAPPISVPAECMRPRGSASPAGSTARSPSLLNGTYRWVLTEDAARAFGKPAYPDASNPWPILNEIVLRDGTWRSAGDEPDAGSYSVAANRVTFDFPSFGYSNTFTFRRDRDGTLHLTAVQPMDRGDQFVWSGAPWKRIGPPREIRP